MFAYILFEAINNLDKLRKGEKDTHNISEEFEAFVKEFNLLDPSTFGPKTSKPTL